jgi:formylmethanofuran dehydrogenase subunit C
VRPLTFTLLFEPSERLDLSPLTLHKIEGMAKHDIERIGIGLSKRPQAVGDLFRVSGENVHEILIEGGSSRFDCVGAEMTAGSITVTGDVGAQAGRKMRGGHLTICGSAGPHAGSGMRGGRLVIEGDAGDQLGGPLAGELTGMAGGILIVRGRAGDHAGDRMRRGMIAVAQGCGDYPGSRMIAGTLVAAGGAGLMPGYLMKRGSILLDREPTSLSPAFLECGAPDNVFAAIVDRYLIAQGIMQRPLLGQAPRKYGGDNAVSGLGEILYPRL